MIQLIFLTGSIQTDAGMHFLKSSQELHKSYEAKIYAKNKGY